MAKLLNKDPYTYQREHGSFLRELKQFHELRGTSFKRVPRINGREIDLYLLYILATSQGGWEKINDRNEWERLCPHFHIPESCTNGGVALKQIYLRYLDHYEKIHFHGEDPTLSRGDDIEGRHKRKVLSSYHNVSLTYNSSQHNISDVTRSSLGLSTTLHQSCDYEKLMLSLLCPLPNDQDFSINVCTLLSNEGQHTLRLDRCPRLVDFLLAFTGICDQDNVWQLYESRNAAATKFWRDVISLPSIQQLLPTDFLEEDEEDTTQEENLFAKRRQQDIRERDGSRMQQIAHIIRNLSFDEPNRLVLAQNNACLCFLLLCAYSQYGCLPQLALDTLTNLCADLELQDSSTHLPSALLLSLVEEGIHSSDRAHVLMALECLNKLAQQERNEDELLAHLQVPTYHQVCLYLALPDILLLIHTLECLYALSALGELACNAISNAPGALQSLFSLLTVEGQSYGPRACILMKVVESGDCKEEIPKPSEMPRSTIIQSARSLSQNTSSSDEKETFIHSWLRSYLDQHVESSMEQAELYREYLASMAQQGKKHVLSAQDFVCAVRLVFGTHVGPVKRILPSGAMEYHYQGLRRQTQPSVMTPLNSLPSDSNPRASPILKAQLGFSNGRAKKEQLQVGSSSSTGPSQGQSVANFSLIRSLLASKVSQRQKQRQEEVLAPPVKQIKLEDPQVVSAELNGDLDEQETLHKDPIKVRGILAEMLERKVSKEPQNGVVGKEIRISERGLELVVNHLRSGTNKLVNGDPQANGEVHTVDQTAPSNLLESLVREVGIPDMVEVAEPSPVVLPPPPPPPSTSLGQLLLPGQNNSMLVSPGQGQRQLVFFQTTAPTTSRPMVYVQSPQSFLVTSTPSSPVVLTNSITSASLPSPSPSANIKTVILMTSQGQKVMLPAQTFPAAGIQLQPQLLTTSAITGSGLSNDTGAMSGTRLPKPKAIRKKPQLDKPPIVPHNPPTSTDVPASFPTDSSQAAVDQIVCEWHGCNVTFASSQALYSHACQMHCPAHLEEQACMWEGCDQMRRRRFSLMTHLLDRHCGEQALQQNRRRRSAPSSVRTESLDVSSVTVHPGYAPNAALQAIRRHALETFTTKDCPDENEGPVTKSIRLTAALILRNLGIYSFHARSYLRAHEPKLVQLAMSNQESARTLAQVLCDLGHEPSSS